MLLTVRSLDYFQLQKPTLTIHQQLPPFWRTASFQQTSILGLIYIRPNISGLPRDKEMTERKQHEQWNTKSKGTWTTEKRVSRPPAQCHVTYAVSGTACIVCIATSCTLSHEILTDATGNSIQSWTTNHWWPELHLQMCKSHRWLGDFSPLPVWSHITIHQSLLCLLILCWLCRTIDHHMTTIPAEIYRYRVLPKTWISEVLDQCNSKVAPEKRFCRHVSLILR